MTELGRPPVIPDIVEEHFDEIRSEDGYVSGMTNQEEIQKIAALLLG